MTGFYVYIYLDALNAPYYVGMGQGKRFMRWHNIWMIRDLEEILIEGIGRKCLGTGPLTNLAKGGQSSKTGWKHSEEAKTRISNKLKGVPKSKKHIKSMRNKIFTIEHREKIRQANLGRVDDGRNAKIGITMSMKRWYNNGEETKMCVPGMEPMGFNAGRKLNVVA